MDIVSRDLRLSFWCISLGPMEPSHDISTTGGHLYVDSFRWRVPRAVVLRCPEAYVHMRTRNCIDWLSS
ncbi:hypothetical protein BABINDRAFT_126182 [Babjeviella inositovora NRRL Y-12698]|uniref:Uncharacterized protein n=1 Tax=Babjeviella inositovora NRRL Y-12698 TaxID=984486 RepID=A0A1E3QUN9_9ASCO|nr:uncharacterized protein BABINDRAFT_126182 [Babjeviella inositovora NRRL Y-12698]ODQ80702.1 hypothetical protein BABINDRAFT_126182 [Babjeviella inositovora NRRL Y-12698]